MQALPTETPLVYEDELGVEHTVLEFLDDGIQFVLRGQMLRGLFVDDAPDQPWRNCRFEGSLPLWITIDGERHATTLGFILVRGALTEPGPSLRLILETPFRDFEVEMQSADFWTALNLITAQLPPRIRLHCCFGCQFSDYSPFGQYTFGSMICVFETRERWLDGRNKGDWIAAHGDEPEWIRETHICEHFRPRLRSAGYRC